MTHWLTRYIVLVFSLWGFIRAQIKQVTQTCTQLYEDKVLWRKFITSQDLEKKPSLYWTTSTPERAHSLSLLLTQKLCCRENEKWKSDRQVTRFIHQSPISFIKNVPRTNGGQALGSLRRADELWKAELSFRVLDSMDPGHAFAHMHVRTHTRTYAQTQERENCLILWEAKCAKES